MEVDHSFTGYIAKRFDNEFWAVAEQSNLDTRFLQRYAKNPLLAMVHEVDPVRYFFVGSDSADLYFDPEKLPQGWQKTVQWVHFGGISLSRAPLSERLLALASELKKAGVKISYDPNFRVTMAQSYDSMLARMTALADVVKVSDEDLRGLLRTCDEGAALQRLRSFHPEAIYLVTEGAKGASLYAKDEAIHALVPKVKVVDTVGAGDASIGGLLVSLMHAPDAPFADHLKRAIACGSAACTVAGAGLPEAAKIKEIEAAVSLT